MGRVCLLDDLHLLSHMSAVALVSTSADLLSEECSCCEEDRGLSACMLKGHAVVEPGDSTPHTALT